MGDDTNAYHLFKNKIKSYYCNGNITQNNAKI